MKPLDAARSRALSILVIVACVALGTITVIRRTGDMWYYFAGIFYGIAAINATAEILLWKRTSKQRRARERMKEQQGASEDKDQSSPSN